MAYPDASDQTASDETSIHEQTPLLRSTPELNDDRPTPASPVHARLSIALVVAAVTIINIATVMTGPPMDRICEDIICHQYYERLQGRAMRDIDESLCKVDEIQEELAVIIAGVDVSNMIPAILFAVPFGILSDRIGRRKAFGIAIVGVVLSLLWLMMVLWWHDVFPIRLVWVSGLFRSIGAGDTVASACLYALVSDLVSPEHRSSIFMVLQAASYASGIVTPLLTAILMDISPWIPVCIGTACVILGSTLIAFVPETLQRQDVVRSGWKGMYKTFAQLAALCSVPMIILMLGDVSRSFSTISITFLPRYVSKRFGWTLARAGTLDSIRAAVFMGLVFCVLPPVSKWLQRGPRSSQGVDLLLARVSVVLLLLGALVIGAAPNVAMAIVGLVLSSLGFGFPSMCRSLMSSLVDQEHIGRLYAGIALFENVAMVAGSPLLATLFKRGLRRGGFWIGLPFYGLASMYFVSLVAIFGLRLPS